MWSTVPPLGWAGRPSNWPRCGSTSSNPSLCTLPAPWPCCAQHKSLTPARPGKHRFLHIPLFNAERAWAYGMELKKEIEKEMHLPKRQHMIARLAKAHKHACEAALLISQRCA